MFDETRRSLEALGLPKGDLWDLPESTKRFPDGAHFRIEIPTVNSVDALRSIFETAEKLGIVVNRVDETYGIFRYTAQEVKDYARIGREYGAEINMAVGPRATYDTGATVLTSQGVRIGYRLRGMEQVVRAVEDVKRACEAGIRGILVYDEGLLWVLKEMREAGELPSNLHYKLSAHCGAGNPASFRVLDQLGADSINPVRDLQLPMLAALRAAVDVPLDIHTDNPPGSGGFIRTYEAPEITKVAAPVYLKTGNSQVSGHGQRTTAADAERMVGQAAIVVEFMKKYMPEAVQSKPHAEGLSVPEA